MTELQNTTNNASYNNWLDRSTTQLPPINFNTMNPSESFQNSSAQVKLEEMDSVKPVSSLSYPGVTTPNASSSWLSTSNAYSPKDSSELSFDGEDYYQHGQPTPSPTASTCRSKKHKTPSTKDIHVERNTEGKPPYSYATLIKYAIENSQRKKLTLSEIYQWVIDHYPYYATAGSGWKVNFVSKSF